MTDLKAILAKKEAQAIPVQQAILALQEMQVKMESTVLTEALATLGRQGQREIQEAAVLMELTASTVLTALTDRMVIKALQEKLEMQKKEERLDLRAAVALRVKTELTELTG
jgi:hypothetical protein